MGEEPAVISRTERKKERTRKQLLEVALALFFEKGIYWTKIEDITERADVGKGTFYQYFETKEALLQELLQQGLDDLLDLTREAVAEVGTDPKALISGVVRARLDFFHAHPEYLLLFHQVRGLLQMKTESAKGLRDVYERHLDQLAKILSPTLNGKGGSARGLATAVAAFTSGLLTYHLLFDGPGDSRRQRQEIQEQIERSLQAAL
jgi:AcrR family transcriptional regulator